MQVGTGYRSWTSKHPDLFSPTHWAHIHNVQQHTQEMLLYFFIHCVFTLKTTRFRVHRLLFQFFPSFFASWNKWWWRKRNTASFSGGTGESYTRCSNRCARFTFLGVWRTFLWTELSSGSQVGTDSVCPDINKPSSILATLKISRNGILIPIKCIQWQLLRMVTKSKLSLKNQENI